MRRIRCAIYTRKSSEEGLEQDFNSLDAQREACEAFVASQKHEGWELLPERYDDGGISGGHLDRPGLQQLMQAVANKQVDQIVVYKIDRLTRSLADFAKLVDQLDAAEASFVSVTQSFNTSTSMGRLTLNVLLSFAQFEREVTAERIRDKIAASKRKGLWMGGNVPIGYQPNGRTLVIHESEAQTIRTIYELYLKLGTVQSVTDEAKQLGLKSRLRVRGAGRVTGGRPFDRGHIHHILTNPIYAGRIKHRTSSYEGQHPAIIEPAVWDRVQRKLQAGSAKPRSSNSKAIASPLAGKLFDETGDRLTPTHSRKNGKRLRYYISRRLITDKSCKHPDAWRLPAELLEEQLAKAVTDYLSDANIAESLFVVSNSTEIATLVASVGSLNNRLKTLRAIDRVDVSPGTISCVLSATRVGDLIGLDSSWINQECLQFERPFQMRRRGVELKLHLGKPLAEVDRTLVANLVRARRFLNLIIEGVTFAEIAEREGISKRRTQDLTDLAFLSPKTLEAISLGTQPLGLTSDFLIKQGFSAIWSGQELQFSDL